VLVQLTPMSRPACTLLQLVIAPLIVAVRYLVMHICNSKINILTESTYFSFLFFGGDARDAKN